MSSAGHASWLSYSVLFILSLVVIGSSTWISKNHFPVEGRTVVITGGSQGMGLGLGRLLAKKGANVVIVARNKEKLQEALENISSAACNPSQQRFHTISADVTVLSENTRIIDEVTAWNNGTPPDIVWANAGMSNPSLFLDASIETMRAQMDINYWAAVYLARATLRAWLKLNIPAETEVGSRDVISNARLPYHFITTSSVAAFDGIAGYTPYSPAKAALRSFHDTLSSELNLYNGASSLSRTYGNEPTIPEIKVHCVFPGTILSPGLVSENLLKPQVTKFLEEGDLAQTGDEVAIATVSELEKGRSLITTQMLGAAMRASSLMGSPRDRWFVDTVFSWVTSIAWLFIAPDMANKVWKWGKENGFPKHEAY